MSGKTTEEILAEALAQETPAEPTPETPVEPEVAIPETEPAPIPEPEPEKEPEPEPTPEPEQTFVKTPKPANLFAGDKKRIPGKFMS